MQKLINVEELFPIQIESWTYSPKYKSLQYFDLRERPLKVTKEEFENYAKQLKEKYPRFIIRERLIKGKKFIIVQGEANGKRTMPLYYCLEEQKLYVPTSWLRRRKRLRNYILFRALGTLKKLKLVGRESL
jgi:hypothetical protein